jgi:transposase
MLRRETEGRQGTFGDMTRAAQSVPRSHLLLQMKAAVDWTAVEQMLAVYYAAGEGRPSWPPTVLLRMLILEEYADLSDRQVSEQVAYNLLYRAFVGLGTDDGVPDDTTLVRFRARIGEEGSREVFELMNRRWKDAGLVSGDQRVLDGSHIWAKVARRSWVSLMRRGRSMVVEAVEAKDGAVGQRLREEYVPAKEEKEPRGEEALASEKEQTKKLLEEVAGIADERVKERAELLQAMLGESDRPVSFEDPDARWGHKRKDFAFCGYKTHESMDPGSRIITAVDVLPGNANEAVRTAVLLEQEKDEVAAGATIIGDSMYNNATSVGQVEKAGGRACFAGLGAQRVSDAFDYDSQTDQVVCAEGRRSIGKVRVDQGDLYYFLMGECASCPRRAECLSPAEHQGSSLPRRRVYLSDVRKRKILSGEAGRQWRREQLRVRGRIESKFDEQMNGHGLRKARYWGLSKMTLQVLLNVITVNLKRVVRLLKETAALQPRTAVSGAVGL